jgi:hypothetical protein
MLSQTVIVFASCLSVTVPNSGDSSAASLILVIYPLVGLHCLQLFLYSCVFMLCVAMDHLFDDVTACLLCHCLATDDFSC